MDMNNKLLPIKQLTLDPFKKDEEKQDPPTEEEDDDPCNGLTDCECRRIKENVTEFPIGDPCNKKDYKTPDDEDIKR